MKLTPALLSVSLAANVALLTMFALKPSLVPPSVRQLFSGASDNPAASPGARASMDPPPAAAESRAAAHDAALWQKLYSSDLRTLVAQLRAAGFPPSAIRGVVEAELEVRYRGQVDALLAKIGDIPYWKSERGARGTFKIYDEISTLMRERGRLMRDLLGDDLFAAQGVDAKQAQQRRFGSIPKHKLELVQRIAEDYAEMTNQVRTAALDIFLPEDREKLALLERERRADLAAILTPEEMEEFEMRTSTVTSRLRSTLTYMDATEDEFKTIFRAYQPVADIVFPSGGMSRELMRERQEAQQKVLEQLKIALGEPRYSDFARANTPEYQQLARMATAENIPHDSVQRAFALRDTAAQESSRIFDDASLTTEQKHAALKTLAGQTRIQALTLLGPTVGEAYLKGTRWYDALNNGRAFSFGPDGTSSRYRVLPPPVTTAPRS